ncbi:MAG: hypothetical protein QM730_09430 [Anaerolineales bacterium]
MKTTQSTITFLSKKRKLNSCLLRFLGIVGVALLFYYGYCWGLWGRRSLLLQYLFQCNCPPANENARYPDEVDVIVSACSYAGAILSPTGNLLYVREGARYADTFSSMCFLDLRTNKKTPFFIGNGSYSFLTDNLLFLQVDYGHDEYKSGYYILDRTTGKQYPIQPFIFLRDDAYINSEPNLEVLATELREAKDVYLIDNVFKTIVALKSDYQESPEHSFYFHDLPGYDTDRGEQFLQGIGVDYYVVPGLFQKEALSPDGRFIAREDGIYLAGSGKKIIEAYTAEGITGKYFSVRGWTYDSSSVIYQKFLDACLLELPSYDGGVCTIPVPQPLIKLKVPQEYLLPKQTP